MDASCNHFAFVLYEVQALLQNFLRRSTREKMLLVSEIELMQWDPGHVTQSLTTRHVPGFPPQRHPLSVLFFPSRTLKALVFEGHCTILAHRIRVLDVSHSSRFYVKHLGQSNRI